MNIINAIFIKIKSVMSYLFWHEKWQPKVLFFFFSVPFFSVKNTGAISSVIP